MIIEEFMKGDPLRGHRAATLPVTSDMELYNSNAKLAIDKRAEEAFFMRYLPRSVQGATERAHFAEKRVYASFIALEYCIWIQYNQDWLNMLIFDIDEPINIGVAWDLCKKEVGLHPTWICETQRGVHIGYVLRDRIAYSWKKSIKLARQIKVAVTERLGADIHGSHRLQGWWRNPFTHDYYLDTEQLVSLNDFYHLLPKQSKKRRFKADVAARQRSAGNFAYKVGNRNNYLWYTAMQITKNRKGFDDTDNVLDVVEYLQNTSQVEDKLDKKELLNIAKSVAKYNADGKNFVKSESATIRKRKVKEGAMGFEKMKGLTTQEYRAEVKRRQRLAAQRTNEVKDMAKLQDHIRSVHEKRKEDTRRSILNCVTSLMSNDYKKKSGAWHYGKISKETGISTKTIARYIKQFQEEGLI